MLLALILAQALQPASPDGPIYSNPATLSRYAFFEAFPASGAGTFGVCSTTPPTGAKGEPLTFARASTATCTKTAAGGLATTGIANGDLVTMSSNLPRVEYDSAGTLGLLVESSRTNSALRSEELNNSAWTGFATGVAVPTVTADAVQGPFATPVAERLQFPAVTTAQNSILFQSPVTTAAVVSTCSVYVRGNAQSETTDLCIQGSGYTCAPCAFVPTSWSRCTVTATAGGALQCFIGNAGSLSSVPTARNAVDFFATAFQAEAGAYATSYIPTTSAAVTRVAEGAYMTVSAIPTASGCVAASVQLEALDGDKGVVGLGETTSGLIRYPTASEVRLYANGVSPAAQAGVALSSRLVGAWGAASEVCVNGTCAVGGATTMAAGSRVGFMDYYTWGWGLRAGNGIISRVQLDPVFTRCR